MFYPLTHNHRVQLAVRKVIRIITITTNFTVSICQVTQSKRFNCQNVKMRILNMNKLHQLKVTLLKESQQMDA